MKIGYHASANIIQQLQRNGKLNDLPTAFQIMPFGYELFGKFTGSLLERISQISVLKDRDILFHLPYTISMKPNPEKTEMFVSSLKHFIELCKQFEFYGLVLHVTSVGDEQIIIDFLSKIDPEDRKYILLENMAHKASFSLEQINRMAKELGCGVCLDTAHWFSSGHPAVKITELKAIHFNSVFYDFGSHKDLHCDKYLLDDPEEHLIELKKLISMQDKELLENIPIVTEIHWDKDNVDRRPAELQKIQEIIEDSFKMGDSFRI